MAAKQLDKMWDGWMVTLSASYEKALAHLDANQVKEAREELRMRLVPTVKKIYTEAPQTYPARFAKIGDWCAWVRSLYIMALKAERALAGNNVAEGTKLLAALREHFYLLHRETETAKVNDWIYAFAMTAAQDSPAVDELKKLRDGVAKAPLSVKAAASRDQFETAKTDWLGAVDGVLKDGRVNGSEIASLRKASNRFYRAFGVQFE